MSSNDEADSHAESDSLTGQEFAGRYHVGQPLGEGGYGTVYRASDLDIDRKVALKILKPSGDNGYSENRRKRFLREAKLVGGLSDPHTVTLFETGHDEETGLLYAVYELVDGETLSGYVKRNGPRPALEVAKLIEQVLESLAEAHKQGIVHRDVKPGNVMISEHDRRGLDVTVLDFGVGKKLTQEDNLTTENTLLGTHRYMAPEYLEFLEDELSPAVDVWAVGMLAFYALTGEPAISGKRTATVLRKVIEFEEVEFPEDLNVPEFFEKWIRKALSRDVSGRYESAVEMLSDLDQLKASVDAFEEPSNGSGQSSSGEIVGEELAVDQSDEPDESSADSTLDDTVSEDDVTAAALPEDVASSNDTVAEEERETSEGGPRTVEESREEVRRPRSENEADGEEGAGGRVWMVAAAVVVAGLLGVFALQGRGETGNAERMEGSAAENEEAAKPSPAEKLEAATSGGEPSQKERDSERPKKRAKAVGQVVVDRSIEQSVAMMELQEEESAEPKVEERPKTTEKSETEPKKSPAERKTTEEKKAEKGAEKPVNEPTAEPSGQTTEPAEENGGEKESKEPGDDQKADDSRIWTVE